MKTLEKQQKDQNEYLELSVQDLRKEQKRLQDSSKADYDKSTSLTTEVSSIYIIVNHWLV